VFLERFENSRIRAKMIAASFVLSQPSFTNGLGRTASTALPHLVHDASDIAVVGDCGIESDGVQHRSHPPLRVRSQVSSIRDYQKNNDASHCDGGNKLRE